MNSHVQLDSEGNFLRLISAGLPIEWDENNYCTAFALEAEKKADNFRVWPLYSAAKPSFNSLTHRLEETDPKPINGMWTEQWKVVPLTSEEIAAQTKHVIAAKWEGIKAERDRRAALGVKVDRHWFHSDAKSRIQQLGLVLLGNSIPAGLQWKTLTFTPPPVFVTMTPELAKAIVAATAASDTRIFTAAEVHRIALESSADPQNYDFSVGWPTTIEDEANEAGITFDQSLL